MKSMTAYATASMTLQAKRYRLEIQTLNKKGLEVQTDLPPGCLSLNIPIRLFVAEHLERSSVFIRLKEETLEQAPVVTTDLKGLKKQLEDLAQGIGYPKEVITFNLLLDKATNLPLSSLTFIELEPLIKQAMSELIEMRASEGNRLKVDFSERFSLINQTLVELLALQKKIPLSTKDKLLERLKNLGATDVDEERLAKEVLYHVEKQDVTEEMTRLKSHLAEMAHLLKSETPVGRKLEFLVQECFRETGTLLAKSSDLSIINLALILKNEFEKVKEQVMNIE